MALECEFTVTREENALIGRCVTNCVWRLPENSKKTYLLKGVNILLWVLVGYWIAYSYEKFGSHIGKLVILSIVLGFATKSIYALILSLIRKSLPLDPGPSIGHKKFSADASGVTLLAAHFSLHVKWVGVYQIMDCGAYILLFTDRDQAIYIPKRSIVEPYTEESFMNELMKLKHQVPNP